MAIAHVQLAQNVLSLLHTAYSFSSSMLPRASPFSSSSTSLSSATLDEAHITQLLRWMKLYFEHSCIPEEDTLRRALLHELYNLYTTIRSDFAGYQTHQQYNRSLWLLSSYRQRDLTELTKKIQDDVRLLHEALQLFSHLSAVPME